MALPFLTIFWFLGLNYGIVRWLKIDPANAPLFSISFSGMVMFAFAITGALKFGTFMLLVFGFILAVTAFFEWWKHKTLHLPLAFILLICVMILGSYLITYGMKFTVDDDYVYWGIIGKYLSQFHHLPDSDTTIIQRHLAYTPGTSLIHYLAYQLAGGYGQAVSYFAQTLFLASALCVVFYGQKIKTGLILFCLLIGLMSLFSGSVFTKLQVDYLLSIYFFSIVWILLKNGPNTQTLLTIGIPICFLFLIKEIGLFMGAVLLAVFLIDFLFLKKKEDLSKWPVFSLFCLTAGLIVVLKMVWGAHCDAMGFGQFNSGINKDSIITALRIFSEPGIQKGFLIFSKELFIGASDRLNLPYTVWYAVMGYAWVTIYSKSTLAYKRRIIRISMVLMMAMALYLLMLYLLQMIVFNIGTTYDHTVGFDRYMNILFAPLVWLCFLLAVEKKMKEKGSVSRKTAGIAVTIIVVVLLASRVETTLRREPQYLTTAKIASQIQSHIDTDTVKRIGVIPGTDRHYLWIRLLYHLLPSRIVNGGFPHSDQTAFYKQLKKVDYLMIYTPGDIQLHPNVVEWLNPLMEGEGDITGFYRIDPVTITEHPENNRGQDLNKIGTEFRLNKLF